MFVSDCPERGRTELLIAAPSDGLVLDYFRALAARWPEQITEEHLTLEGEVPIASGLSLGDVSPAVEKLVAAEAQLVSHVDLSFGGLKVSYVRSSGQSPEPVRDGIHDEIIFDLDRTTGNELIAQVAVSSACTRFDVQGLRSDQDLSPLLPLPATSR